MGHIVKDIPPFHRELYKMMDEMSSRKYMWGCGVLFRGAAKSTISKSIKGLHDIVYGHEPVSCWISESQQQSADDLEGVKEEALGNEYIKRFYGIGRGNTWSANEAEFSNGAFIICKGYTSRIRGIKHKNIRPTKFLLDDFESEHNLASAKQRENVTKWINRAVTKAGTANTIFQFFGTIVHSDAWLAGAKDYSFFKAPSGKYLEYVIEKDGVPTWEAMYNMDYIKNEIQKSTEQGDLSGIMQEWYNIPAISGRASFNTENIKEMNATFQTYEHITYLQKDGKKIPLNVFTGVDPASRTGSKNDDTVIFTIGITPSKSVVILDIDARKMSPTDQIPAVFEANARYRPRLMTIETQGYQLALVSWLRDKMQSGNNLAFPIKEFSSNMSKNNKYLQGLSPLIDSGNVFYLSGCRNIDVLFRQLESYNFEERDHDDTIDGFYLSYLNAYQPAQFNVDSFIHEFKLNKSKGRKRKRSWMSL